MPQENKSVTMHSASYPLSDVLRTLIGLVYSTKKENGGASGRFERYLDNPINMRYFFNGIKVDFFWVNDFSKRCFTGCFVIEIRFL